MSSRSKSRHHQGKPNAGPAVVVEPPLSPLPVSPTAAPIEPPAAPMPTAAPIEPPAQDRAPAGSNGLCAFLLHLHPRTVRRRTSSVGATLGLGLGALIAIGAATLSGLLLMVYYVPSVERAHASVQDLIAVVPMGRWMRSLHRWAGHAAVLFAFLHLLRVLLWGAYRGTHRRVWLLGFFLLLALLATSYSGYLLPWDQDAFWTVTVGTSLIGYVPLLGEWLKEVLLGGTTVGQATLTRFYVLHVALLPFLGLLLLTLHLFRLRRAGGLARPPAANGPGEELVPPRPTLIRRELALAALLSLVLGVMALFADAQLGPAPDLLRPDDPPKAPWFLVGVQEAVSYSASVGGILVMGVLFLLIALLPWLDGGLAADGTPVRSRTVRLALPSATLLTGGAAILAVRWWGDSQAGQLAWLNPASIAGLTALASALLALLIWRNRAVASQALLTGGLAALLVFTAVGWFWRGPDWKLTYHPGPGRAYGAAARPGTGSALSWQKQSRAAGGDDTPLQIRAASGAVDRCPTCHRPVLATPARRSTHPPVPGHSDLAAIGCSSCHGGQGRRLDNGAHQPALGEGPEPFLRRPFIEARCARCHLPAGEGTPSLTRGINEYLDAGCTGCHQPGRFDQGLGPDLRRLGRRSEAELLAAILEPERGHGSPVMWSLRWRFDEQRSEGKQSLAALLTAVLAFGENPRRFWSSWARPQARSEAPCPTCHLQTTSGTSRQPHRCPYLRNNHSLRCRACHATAQAALRVSTGKECPQLQAARPTCAVCHGGREQAERPGSLP